MGRRRKNPADAWLPKRVVRGRSAFEWRTPDGRTVRLCRLDAAPAEVLRAYETATAGQPEDGTLAWLVQQYFASERFTGLADASRADYRQSSKKVLAVFGKVSVSRIGPAEIRRYMDRRGKSSRYRANRELSFLHVVLQLGRELGLTLDIASRDIKKFREQRRTSLVDPQEYAVVLSIAPAPVAVAMEIAYCTGLRRADVLALRWADVRDGELVVAQQKTKGMGAQPLAKAISQRLQAALDAAKLLPAPKGETPAHIVHNRSGNPYTGSGFSAVFRRAVAEAGAKFTFHDIRRTAITDYQHGELREFSGHRSIQMAESYAIRPRRSPSH